MHKNEKQMGPVGDGHPWYPLGSANDFPCVKILNKFLPPTYVVRREGTVFTGVCLSTPDGVPHLHPIILQLVPCPFLGGVPE